MCVTSTVIDGWRDPTWSGLSQRHTEPFKPIQPGPNAIPWPIIQTDPSLAAQMLELLKKLEAIDKRLGMLEQCKISAREKKNLKARLRRIAKKE